MRFCRSIAENGFGANRTAIVGRGVGLKSGAGSWYSCTAVMRVRQEITLHFGGTSVLGGARKAKLRAARGRGGVLKRVRAID